VVGIVLAMAGTAMGGEVLFNNGDKLTGKVVEATGGKLTIVSKLAGKITVDMKDVKTFSTDEAVTLRLKDGTVIKQKVAVGEKAGEVATVPGGTLQPQAISLGQVKQINPPKVAWHGALQAGAFMTRGNSHSDSVNFGANAVRRGEENRISLSAEYLYGREKDVKTGERTTSNDRWFAQGKYDHFFMEKWYMYGNLRVERDNEAGLDMRWTPGIGAGYQWIESPDFNFSTEAGATYVYEKYYAAAEANKHLAARLAYHVDKKLNDTVSVFHNMEILPSVENAGDFNLNADAGVRAMFTTTLFGEAKVEWQDNSNPPAERSLENDLRYIFNMGWKY
jgi:putative salt-induced outer membrane protein YdiY